MADAPDFFPSKHAKDPRGKATRPPPPGGVPPEFDTLLTRTADHPGARAVEVELDRQGVPCFRTESGDAVERMVELHVRTADHAYAAQLAGMVFARRQRLNRISPRRPPPRDDDDGPGPLIGGMSLPF